VNLLRSLLFAPLLWLWTGLMVFGCSPVLLGPPRWSMKAQNAWADGADWLVRHVLGIRCEVRGLENLPEGPMIVASKHQSAYETIVFHRLLDDPGIVLKKELLAIPLYGWFSRHMGMIPIDRSGSAKAMRAMLRAAEKVLAQGRPILIFPEGTRSAPGQRPSYRPGVAGLYRHLNVPVVPVALNSGLFWPRRSLLKRPGTVVIEYLMPIPPGLDRRAFMAELEARIEPATAGLLAEAGFRPGDNYVDETRG
jgi:1-acyl-sn-glycerol-3-phosphate acyltransferase